MQIDRFLGAGIMMLALGMVFVAIPTLPAPKSGVLGTGYDWIGPRLFPYMTSALCFLLGFKLAVMPADVDVDSAQPPLNWRSIANVLSLALLSFLYVAGLRVLGYPLGTGLVIMSFLLLFGVRRIGIIACFGILVPVITTLVFDRVLGVGLPTGVYNISHTGALDADSPL